MPPANRSRLPLLLLGALLVSAVLAACGGGKTKSADPTAGASSNDISGTYVVVRDSDGTKPKDGATVTLVLNNGTLSVKAVSADDELTDTGTYTVRDGLMTIEFRDQQLLATDQPYKLDGDTLEIPLKMFSEGKGSSIWMRAEAAVADVTPNDASTPGAAVAGVSTDLDPAWDIYDLNKYATASAMKTFVESVNDRGMTWENAVKAAVDKAKSFPDVTGVTISPNGLNAVITYKDGRDEELLTERFSLWPDGVESSSAIPPPSSERLVSAAIAGAAAANVATAATACPELPASPKGIAKVSGRNLAEPGREGLQPAAGVFGVTVYNAKTQPKPINSADSPPASARKALLFAPLYDVPHPGPLYNKQGDPIVGTWSGFRETTGNNIECISADLKRGGYGIETILGRIEKKKPVETGVDAIVGLTKKLTAGQYGVLYFLTHGAAPDDRTIKLEMGTLGEDERKKIVGDHKITHSEFVSLEDAIRVKILTDAGLPLDDEWKHTIRANMEFNGRLELWVSSEFFRLLREQKGVIFDNTLVFANACSSAANGGLRSAFDAKAFFGWERPPDLVFASEAAQTIFDVLPDKVRTARNAWSMWSRYEKWLEAAGGRPRPPRTQVEGLKAYGKSGIEYPRPSDNTVILIYRIRHGPASASSDITKGITVVSECSRLFWSLGKKPGLASPACTQIGFTTQVPSDEEVADAVFDVGGAAAEPYGRWTMAD